LKNGTVKENCCIYKTMKPDFWKMFVILNYAAKCPDWLRPRYHGNGRKNPASWFCAYCCIVYKYHHPKYGVCTLIRFWVTFVLVFSQSVALLGYHGNQIEMIHIFWNYGSCPTYWYIMCLDWRSGSVCIMVWNIWSFQPKPPP